MSRRKYTERPQKKLFDKKRHVFIYKFRSALIYVSCRRNRDINRPILHHNAIMRNSTKPFDLKDEEIYNDNKYTLHAIIGDYS